MLLIRHTVNNNERFCDKFELTAGCNLAKNDTNFCKFTLDNPDIQPRFRTGRSDCVSDCKSWLPGFCTTEEEIHPNPHGTGVETGIFMNETFNLNVQETAAILGAHAIGRTHKVSSMFRSDPWTPQGIQDWNNLYYINGVNYITTANRTASKSCMFVDPTKFPNTANNFVGDEEGNPISVKFKVFLYFCFRKKQDETLDARFLFFFISFHSILGFYQYTLVLLVTVQYTYIT